MEVKMLLIYECHKNSLKVFGSGWRLSLITNGKVTLHRTPNLYLLSLAHAFVSGTERGSGRLGARRWQHFSYKKW